MCLYFKDSSDSAASGSSPPPLSSLMQQTPPAPSSVLDLAMPKSSSERSEPEQSCNRLRLAPPAFLLAPQTKVSILFINVQH